MQPIDFIGTVVLTTVMVVNVNALISTMPLPQSQRITMAAMAGLWIGLQVALASAGAYAPDVPYVGISVAAPLVAVLFAVVYRSDFRKALLAVPTALLVGLNFSRVFGAFFLILAASGRLGGPFPASAGWGDVLTGLIALSLALAMARGRAAPGAVIGWNAFGMLDLVVAVALGVLSAPGSPIQVIDAGVGSTAVQVLPWSLIPTVLVPFYLIVHGVIFAQVRIGRLAASSV